MRIPRLYVDAPLVVGAAIALPDGAHRHVAQVLRLGVGDAVRVFDGTGGVYEARITATARAGTEIVLSTYREEETESPLRITLAQGIARGERMDYVLQKAVELGVSAIVPLITERTVVKLDAQRAAERHRHWQHVVVSACEQCGRNRVPGVGPAVALETWLQHTPNDELKLLLDPGAEQRLDDYTTPAAGVTLLVGPEGGFSARERTSMLARGCYGLRLGPRVLRTETAALVALSVLQVRWGDLR